MLIPEFLKNEGELKDENEAVLVGVDNRIELWNVKTWSEYKNITDKKADEIAEKLSEK